MKYLDLMERRQSIREFKEREVPVGDVAEIIQTFSKMEPLAAGIHTELLHFPGDAKEKLAGVAGYTGFVIGAPHYLVLMTEEKPEADINAGYLCEGLILKLTEMGLDSCWNTFLRRGELKEVLGIQSDLRPAAVLAFGYGRKEHEALRLNIKSESDVMFHRRDAHLAPKVALEDFVWYERWGSRRELDENLVDDGLHNALYAASLSPSYLNRQPYRMILDFGKVVLVGCKEEETDDTSAQLNYGACMYNFAAALSDTRPGFPKWSIGDDGTDYGLPENCRVIGYCQI